MIRPTARLRPVVHVLVSAVVPVVFAVAVFEVVVADPPLQTLTPNRNGGLRASARDQDYEESSTERTPREQSVPASYVLLDHSGQVNVLSAEQQAFVLPQGESPESSGPAAKEYPSAAPYVEVEILLTDRLGIDDIRALPHAPGGAFEELQEPPRVVVQLPLETVKELKKERVSLSVRRRFLLLKSTLEEADDLAGMVSGGSCTGSNREGSNVSNVNIPDNNGWVFSGITIAGAPAGATVTCIDVHYEIIHSYIGDLEVDLNDQNLTYNYDLWGPGQGGATDNLNQTVTGISTFNGELVNQPWLLYASDIAALDTGYIDTWWIKVYYGGAALQPDLIVQSSSRTPSTVTPGGPVSLADTVKNQGAGAAGSFYVTWFISLDSTVTTTDYEWGFRTVSNLAGGATSSGMGSLPWPDTGTYSAPGIYYIAVTADDTNAVSESDEGNNKGVIWTVTVPSPDPPDIRISPTALNLTCTVSATVPAEPTNIVEKQMPDMMVAGVWSPLKSAHRQAEFTRLKAAALGTGSVPVVVELAVPNIVMLTSRSSAAGTQAGLVQADGALSTAIAAVAQAEVARLRAVPHIPGRIFPYIPFMSLSVSERALEILQASPTVLDINEDRLAKPTLDNTVNIVEASNAWARGFDGAGWYVAILDTGIRASHAFFVGKTVREACFALGQDGAGGAGDCPNGLASDISSPHPAQPYPSSFAGYEHGTHVTGIAAGEDTQRVPPLYGVARRANVVAVQIFSKFPSSPFCDPPGSSCVNTWDSDLIAGLNYVYSLRLTHNLAAVNMSLSGAGPFNDQTSCDNGNSATKAIIDSLRSAGIASIIATGNEGFCDGIGAPACISSAISVGSVNDSDSEAASNNYGALLDLFAPGVSVLSSVASSDTAYASLSGTSMATPHVTGAWAILKQAVPSATVTEAFNALQSTGGSIANACSGSGTYPQHRIRINSAIDELGGGCSGQLIAIHNDGQSILEVCSVTRPSWAQLSPLPPYSIAGGGSRQVCVTVDCGACASGDLGGSIDLNSNDPITPTVNASVHVDCPPACTPGSPCPDEENACTNDVYDANCVCTHPKRSDCIMWRELGLCIRGPALETAPDCLQFDYNGDGHVDLADASEFLLITGHP